MAHQLSIKKAILYAINTIVSDPWYFVKVWLVWMAISLGFVFLGLLLSTLAVILFPPLLVTMFFISCFADAFIWYFPTKLLLDYHDKGTKTLKLSHVLGLFSIGLLFKLLVASLLYAVLLTAGLILLIIPGIYVAIKFCFRFLRLIDVNCSVLEAFRNSYAITTGNFWRLCGLVILVKCLMYLIITLPVALLILIHAYRQLQPAGK